MVSFSATTEASATGTAAVTLAGGLGVAKDMWIGDDIVMDSDSAVLKFGDDQDTTLTHTDGTGLTLNSTNKLTFGDTASFVQQSSDGVLRIDGEATVDINASTAVLVSNDLKLDSDAAVLGFGVNNDVTLTHVHDTGVLLNSTRQIQFGDSASYIAQSSDGTLRIDGEAIIDLNASTRVDVSTDLKVGDDLNLASDSAAVTFGGDSEIAITHLHNQGLSMTSTHDAPLVRRGEDVFIVLDQTAADGTDAGDNVIMDRSAADTDVGDDIIGEDEVFLHSGMQRNVINIIGSDGKIKNSVAGFAPGAI